MNVADFLKIRASSMIANTLLLKNCVVGLHCGNLVFMEIHFFVMQTVLKPAGKQSSMIVSILKNMSIYRIISDGY